MGYVSIFYVWQIQLGSRKGYFKRSHEKGGVDIAGQFGGVISAMYALMGAYDLVLIANFPNMKEALQASIAITKATGISFSTLPAMPVDEFDELMANK